jgi:hypothetical protein
VGILSDDGGVHFGLLADRDALAAHARRPHQAGRAGDAAEQGERRLGEPHRVAGDQMDALAQAPNELLALDRAVEDGHAADMHVHPRSAWIAETSDGDSGSAI